MAHVYEIDGVVPVIDVMAFVHPNAVLIGDVVIGSGVYIGPNSSLRGDFGRVFVDAGANVQDNCVLHCFPGREVRVGENGHIGHGAVLHGCRIGEGALVGINAVVMDEADIGEYSFVAASSFVRAGTTVPPRHLVAGIPAEIRRELTSEEIEWKANGTRLYQELAARSSLSLRAAEPLTELTDERLGLPIKRSESTPLHQYRAERRGD